MFFPPLQQQQFDSRKNSKLCESWVAAIMEGKTREIRDTIMMRYLAILAQIKLFSCSSLLIHIY